MLKKERTTKTLAVLLAMIMLAFSLTACAAPTQEAAPQPAAAVETDSSAEVPATETQDVSAAEATVNAADIKVAYIVKWLGNTFWQTYEAGARAAAADLGVQIDVFDVDDESDFQGQLETALNVVNQDYNAIVAASITNTNLIPAIAKANEAGIPWIVVSEDQDDEVLQQYNAYVTCKCRLSFLDEGRIAAQYVKDQLGDEGEVAVIEGLAGTSATRDRCAGFAEGLEGTNIKTVASQPGDWDRQKAYDVASSMLQANPNIKAIYALNDTMALGVQAAAEQAGKTDVLVIGDDGTMEAFESIKNNQMDATIDGVAYQIAYYSVYAAVKAVAEDLETLPNYDLTPGLITVNNAEEAIAVAPQPVAEMYEINKNIYLPIAGIKE